VFSFFSPCLVSSTPQNQTDETKDYQIEYYTYKVLETYPHDPGAFVQGLTFYENLLYEGTGNLGESTLRRVDLFTGEVLQLVRLDDHLFGEGITVIGDKIYQLTYHTNFGFIYDRVTFEVLSTWNYPTLGWGLTHDESHLILSDGTSTIFFYDISNPELLVRQITVVNEIGVPIDKLNELEYINGEIYANIFYSNSVVIIDPVTGSVKAWIDFTGLSGRSVFNGIAYNHINEKLYVTGKYWDHLYEVELIPIKH